MNLSEANLVQFRTKAITEDGSRLVFVGKDSDTVIPYNFVIVSSPNPIHINATTSYRESGVAQNVGLSIKKIVPPWIPRRGDIVRVKGLMVHAPDTWQPPTEYRRSGGTAEVPVLGIFTHDGYFHVSWENKPWIVHRDSMRLVRRE